MGSEGETDYKVFVGGISWNMSDENLMDGERVVLSLVEALNAQHSRSSCWGGHPYNISRSRTMGSSRSSHYHASAASIM